MRAILWDMDGTLLDSEPAHEAAFDHAVAELGLDLGRDFGAGLLGQSADQVHAALVTQTPATLDRAAWMALKWRHFQRAAVGITRREPVASLVPVLHARGVPMAVVSNSTAEEVALCLGATGLQPLFPLSISRDDLERGKPAPDGYLLAAERLGVAPGDCLVVEDSPVGAQAGVAAGMTVLFHPQSDAVAPPPGAVMLAHDAESIPLIESFLATGALR